jgi:hypothetical protein
MGAAASVNHIYQSGFDWFQQVMLFERSCCQLQLLIVPFLSLSHSVYMQYFDENLYIQDFRSMDKDKDGGT